MPSNESATFPHPRAACEYFISAIFPRARVQGKGSEVLSSMAISVVRMEKDAALSNEGCLLVYGVSGGRSRDRRGEEEKARGGEKHREKERGNVKARED